MRAIYIFIYNDQRGIAHKLRKGERLVLIHRPLKLYEDIYDGY